MSQPDQANTCYTAGLAALEQGDGDAALAWLARCYAAAGEDNPHCLALRGAIASEEGDLAIAIEVLQRANTLAPADLTITRQLSTALAANGDLPTAIATIQRAITLAPADPAPLLELARLAQLADDYPTALTAIERALTLQPTDPALHLLQTDLHEAQGAPVAATALLATVAPQLASPALTANLARLALAAADFPLAEETFRLLATHDPDALPLATHGIIWTRLQRGDWEGALELALLSPEPDHAPLTAAMVAYSRTRLFSTPSPIDIATREAALDEAFQADLLTYLAAQRTTLLDHSPNLRDDAAQTT